MKILKKVSVATVCNKPKSFFKELKEETPLMRIIGVARSVEVGQSTYGEYLKFKGEFRAVNLETGEVMVGAVAFLPQPVDQLLAAQIRDVGNDGKSPVEFGFDISVVPDEKTEVGFQYRVSTLIETQVSDPLAALASRLEAEKPLALTAQGNNFAELSTSEENQKVEGKAKK